MNIRAFLIFGLCFASGATLYPQAMAAPAGSGKSPERPAAKRRASRPNLPAWKTYVNRKHGFSIRYPASWVVRPFDTGDGAAFGRNASDTAPGRIEIGHSDIQGHRRSLPFPRYVRIIATDEIQGFERLASIRTVQAASGETGYLTTWRVAGVGDGGPSVSAPLTYFKVPGRPATVQIEMEHPKERKVYLEMIRSFAFTRK